MLKRSLYSNPDPKNLMFFLSCIISSLCWWHSEHPLKRGLKLALTEGKTCKENMLRGSQNEGKKGYSGCYHLNNMRPLLKDCKMARISTTYIKYFKGDKNDEFNRRTFLGFQWRRGLLRLRLCRKAPNFWVGFRVGTSFSWFPNFEFNIIFS